MLKKQVVSAATEAIRREIEGNSSPLQYSCLENPMDGGAWEAAVHGVAKSRTRLSDFTQYTCPWLQTSLSMATGFTAPERHSSG